MLRTKNAVRFIADLARRPLLAIAALMLVSCASRPPPLDVPTPPLASQPRDASAPDSPPARERRSPFVEPPGVVFSEVTQATIPSTICVPGWTATVRPSTSFAQSVKRKMLQEAGKDPSEALKYELDHFLPLALGGHPRSIDNLWLQEWNGPRSARIKDRLERNLQLAVCGGTLTLQEARAAIVGGWIDAYKRFVGMTRGMPGIREDEAVE